MSKIELQTALSMREQHGFSVIPLHPNDKKPLTSWKQWQQDYISDADAERYFTGNNNIGIVTGAISGITVVDIDYKDPRSKKTPLDAFPPTYTVKTPSGGYHLYYAYTDTIGTSANQYPQFPHVDIRNDGGFVVAPPSVVNGTAYEVVNDLPLAPFPQELFATKKKKGLPVEKKPYDLAQAAKSFDSMADGSGRNNALTKLCGSLVAKTAPQEWPVVRQQLDFFNAKFSEPLPSAEVDTIFESITKKQSEQGTVSPIAASSLLGIRLRVNGNNQPYKDITNAVIILANHPEYRDSIKYNEFRREVEFRGEPLEENDVIDITTKLQDSLLPQVSDGVVYKAIIHYAHENSYDEVKDWLETLEWDGEPRLAKWLPAASGCPDDEYHRAIGAQWMIGMMRRAMHPGCVFDYVLTAIGGQGVGKTTMFRIIGGPWYKAFTGTVDNKDFYMALRGALVVDLDEGSTMYKSDSIKIKSIITETVDEYRAPYGRVTERHPRRFVFSMSTNDTEPFRDQTGNRRYLPFTIPKKVDFDWLTANRDQLFAEAYDVVKNNRYNEMPQIPFDKALEMQGERIATDSWYDSILEYLMEDELFVKRDPDFNTTIQEIFENVISPDKERTTLAQLSRQHEMRIGGILRNELGFERRRKMENGVRVYRYYLTESALERSPDNQQVIKQEEVDNIPAPNSEEF